MRLLLVSMHTSPFAQLGAGDAGGMNAVLQATAPRLVRLGHTVDLVTRRDDPSLPDVVELGPDLRLHHITAGPATPLAKSVIDNHLDEFGAGLAALDLRPDLVHSHHWMSGVAALPVARAWGVPHLQSYHSVAALPGAPLGHGEPPESHRRVAGEALTARESDLVIAVSGWERQTVIDRCGADAARVVVNHPGVDVEQFRPLRPGERPWTPAADDRPFVLFAARLQPLKAPDLAIEAVGRIPRDRRPRLVVAGDASADFRDYWDELATLVADLDLAEDVEHVGAQARPEFARIMRSSAGLLVPSHSETFGLVALEGQASGVPVVSATSGGLPEAMGDAGVLLDSRDPDDWAAAIERVLEPSVSDDLGRRARGHAEQNTWDDRVAELSAIYRGATH